MVGMAEVPYFFVCFFQKKNYMILNPTRRKFVSGTVDYKTGCDLSSDGNPSALAWNLYQMGLQKCAYPNLPDISPPLII
jgi:hypothetical protein